MRITWKDGLATISMGGALVLSRAYYHDYDWPLVSSTRWVIGGMLILAVIIAATGFVFNKHKDAGWDVLGIFFGVLLATLAILGLMFAISAYVAILMLSAVVIWIVTTGHHLSHHTSYHGRHGATG